MKKLGLLLVMMTVLGALVTGCAKPSAPTASTAPPTQPSATASPTPPIQEPSVSIKLGPGKNGSSFSLDVVAGDYKLTSGATLRAGSAIGADETWLTFPPGLGIDVVGGQITLKGKTYPEGTTLLVDTQGELVPR
jgi:hypothetical protein